MVDHGFEQSFARRRMSWRFIVFAALFILIWIGWNLTPHLYHFDPYDRHGGKFEILNLIMSAEQVLSNPIIYMALFAEMLADRLVNREIYTSVMDLLTKLEQLQETVEEIPAVEILEEDGD